MAMNPRLLRPKANNRFLLDLVPDAAAAYSLRQLRSGYTGAVVQVRRSNDNAEATFKASEVSDGTLAAWVGAGNDGFVKTWYDQSANGRNVTQTTSTLQPVIVSSGSVVTLNGKPAIDWPSATTNRVLVGTISTTSAISALAVFSAVRRADGYQKLYNIGIDNSTSGYALAPIAGQAANDWTDTNTLVFGKGFGSGQSPRIITTGAPVASSATTQNLLFLSLSSATSRLFVNKAEVSYAVQSTGNCSTLTGAALYIGNNFEGINALQQLIGRMQDLVIWTSDVFSSRSVAEQNTGSHYGI